MPGTGRRPPPDRSDRCVVRSRLAFGRYQVGVVTLVGGGCLTYSNPISARRKRVVATTEKTISMSQSSIGGRHATSRGWNGHGRWHRGSEREGPDPLVGARERRAVDRSRASHGGRPCGSPRSRTRPAAGLAGARRRGGVRPGCWASSPGRTSGWSPGSRSRSTKHLGTSPRGARKSCRQFPNYGHLTRAHRDIEGRPTCGTGRAGRFPRSRNAT